MTTITYKDGVMAADTLVTSGYDTVDGHTLKLAKCKGFIAGACGEIVSVGIFLEWVRKGADRKTFPDIEGTFKGLLVSKGGNVVHVSKNGFSDTIRNPFFAIGSGGEAAKGALIAGATAEEAVRAAMAIDIYSGGDVDLVHF